MTLTPTLNWLVHHILLEKLEWNVKSLFESLGISFTFQGPDRKVKGAAAISAAKDTDVSFCYHIGEKGLNLISHSNAGVIICSSSMEGLTNLKTHPTKINPQFIFTSNPRLAFVRTLGIMYSKQKLIGISQKATVFDTAKIGKDCYIGDFTVIGENCEIGDNSIIYDRVSIVQNCVLGHECVIQQGVTIGADGFAYERHSNGSLERFPHIMGVKIGSNVEISANSSVARGSLSDTIIGHGTKLDALVHVAHNVKIGNNCELTAGTIIGGSAILGDMCWTGLNSMIKDNIRIGNNVIVGASAGVIHDVVDGDIVAGIPAKSIKDKVSTNMRYLMAGQK
jgi:UDP-3-O-[3-hydroxymyristoyl] glucosamine N-acyltransferase